MDTINADTPNSVSITFANTPNSPAQKNAAYAAARAARTFLLKRGLWGEIPCSIAITIPDTTNIMKASLSCWLSTTAFPSQYRAGENPAAAPIHARYSSQPPPECASSGCEFVLEELVIS